MWILWASARRARWLLLEVDQAQYRVALSERRWHTKPQSANLETLHYQPGFHATVHDGDSYSQAREASGDVAGES